MTSHPAEPVGEIDCILIDQLTEANVELSNFLKLSTDQCGMGKRVTEGWLTGTSSVWGIE